MGFDFNGIRFLMFAKQAHGVDFSISAMIGRQHLNDGPDECLAEFGYSPVILSGWGEPLLTTLGATEVASFDASAYEGATCIHDFNLPIPDQFHQHYTAVIDCGTLEHVFNYPIALKNCMEMVKLDGHFITATPANNWFAHGFYQFSPDLFYRAFSPENGYRISCMYACEATHSKEWREIPDEPRTTPIPLGGQPSYLLVCAQRVEIKPAFANLTQQSSYRNMWGQ